MKKKKLSCASLLDFTGMAYQKYILLAAILIVVCLDVSSIVATAAAVMWHPKIFRYIGSYNLDKGPVFYEAYYPNTRDIYQEKKRFGRKTTLDTSFQVPLERLAYSEAESTADGPISINESFVVTDNREILPREAIPQRNYDATITSRQLVAPTIFNERFDNDKNSQIVNKGIEEISKLVRRAIAHDLENWNALKRYLDHAIHQDQPVPQPEMHSREMYKDRESDGYMFSINDESKDSSEQPSIFGASLSRKLNTEDEKQRPIHFEGVNTNESTTSEMRVSGIQAVDTSLPIGSDSLPSANIFQPRPQLIKYMFFKRPVPPRLDKQNETLIAEKRTTPWTSDSFIREEIADDNRGKPVGPEDVKVTSIEISELPRHKTRHHHGEWPMKRDYSIHRHHSRSTDYPIVS